ncbi:EamA family transporter RarD [Anaerobacillus isosaccharinicus]|uniref:EamA family transporter n=1 Tax=Anaerobacillus isosaccharinicus TaxID=1532552 RepID=A0A1S2M1T6_9BACI|nr:EamA family transporter RarD [Anaerobacillus isosaccharinicus]MBA5586055.1 EamA family transporter RarD [Anaerobacillus isosaccharinicus]QOY35669.1 EamA family transporter RarD [Anaerobacillus isosaccharinicus]
MGKKLDQHGIGLLTALGAYILWGVLPLYWKLVGHVPSSEVLAHRIIWSLVFMFGILLVIGKITTFTKELKTIFANKKKLVQITLAACFISFNWFTYIWAVNNDHLVEASLGYYINPLVSVVFGMLFFKETLTRWQTISFVLAAIGVITLAIYTGGVPIISLSLAVSFAFYGVLKKKVEVGALTGLAVETMMVTPIAIIYLTVIHSNVSDALYTNSLSTILLLIGAGAATATPLLLFAMSARRIPLATIGFMQYLAPTITLFIGVFMFGEVFSGIHLLAFSFIWVALAVYTLSKAKLYKRMKPVVQVEKQPAS